MRLKESMRPPSIEMSAGMKRCSASGEVTAALDRVGDRLPGEPLGTERLSAQACPASPTTAASATSRTTTDGPAGARRPRPGPFAGRTLLATETGCSLFEVRRDRLAVV